MLCYKDKTFCGSINCKNECGRKLTESDHKELERLDELILVSFSLFCDEEGKVINNAG